jgi:phosphorylcholine metabolism protein LicD
LRQFDYITELKHKNEKLAQELEIEVFALARRKDLDVPYKIMKRLKRYLPYCSEFKENRIKESELGSAKHELQKNCWLDLYNHDREETRMF